jgi:hypothetical protein
LPLSAALTEAAGADAWRYAVQGGEDYELGLSVPAMRLGALQAAAAATGVPCRVVGKLRAGAGMELRRAGNVIQFSPGVDHFALTAAAGRHHPIHGTRPGPSVSASMAAPAYTARPTDPERIGVM